MDGDLAGLIIILTSHLSSSHNIAICIPCTYDIDQRYRHGNMCDIALWLGQYHDIALWYYRCLAQWSNSDTTLVHVLQLWGYKPVNTPLQVLYGIMHSSLYSMQHLLVEVHLYKCCKCCNTCINHNIEATSTIYKLWKLQHLRQLPFITEWTISSYMYIFSCS